MVRIRDYSPLFFTTGALKTFPLHSHARTNTHTCMYTHRLLSSSPPSSPELFTAARIYCVYTRAIHAYALDFLCAPHLLQPPHCSLCAVDDVRVYVRDAAHDS